MSGLLSRATSDSRFQLAATAVVSGGIVAAGLLSYQRLSQEKRVSKLKESIPDPSEEHPVQKLTSLGTIPPPDKEDLRTEALARRAQAGDFDDELILEQLARNRVFLTPEGLDKLRNSFVIVVGCGGVGSHATAAFARSGVSKLRLIDFDQVTLSSLNRHAVATLADVGLPKVQCLQKRLRAIAPWVKFDLRLEKFDGNSAEPLLAPWGENGQKPDFVVDAIDNIDTKVALLKYCHDHQIPVISAMGAGCKSDPTRIIVGDISTTTDDGLSRATRRRLKLQGVTTGIPAVYSTERTAEGKAQLLPLAEEEFQKGTVGDLGVLPDFRVRILPVLGTMPAIFGLTVANHVILKITGYPCDYVESKGSGKTFDSVFSIVQANEERLVRAEPGAPVDVAVGLRITLSVADVSFLVEEMYRGRSAISSLPTSLFLMRWRKPQGSILQTTGEGEDQQKWTTLRMSDLVCMTKKEAKIHEQQVLKEGKSPEDLYDAETLKRVEERIAEIKEYEKYR
ncbi:tRNA threonylcarbamoyladenosine dehydratase 2 [Cytospora mali]|uniref:tRNA threonylcarbamoyladenosine dehydratase 2 n=1 Tax=Cytospora mali TaxID=578113 RepID=A0A194UW80_CYTMA|nr:tRNA threonylcarbamoyladenosine dehydratase 2 [Valsa mali var. pyri (nom. inval.)]